MNELNSSKVISESWRLLSKNGSLIFLVFAAYIILSWIGSIITATIPEDAAGLGLIISLVDLVFSYFLMAGFYRFSLNIVQAKQASVGDLFSQSRATTMKLMVLSFLVGLIVLVGFILLIVPGIILSLQYSMVFQVLIDERVGPLEAMERSSQITSGHKLELFVLGIINVGILLLGVLCLGVGLIVAIPLTWLTTFVAYEMLKSPGSLGPAQLEDGVRT